MMAEAETQSGASEKELFPEKKELMESAREGRLGIMGDALTRVADTVNAAKEKAHEVKEALPEPAKELLNQLADASTAKVYSELGVELKTGKNFMGEKRTPKERIMSLLMAGTNDIGKALIAYGAASGNAELSAAGFLSYGASWALLLKKNGPTMIQNFKDLARHYHQDDASLVLARAGAAFERHGYANLPQVF
jgi:hypothetical protein